MNILNTARVDIEMAGEYIRDELSNENYDKNIEWKQLEKAFERKKKKKSLKHSKLLQEAEEEEPEWKPYAELDEETDTWR